MARIRCKRNQSGAGMVEVLVALVVLSVGMLGIAGLYVTTLRASNGAIFRTLAVNLAADMADRIRANPNAGSTYAGAPADNSCVAGVVDCTRNQMAADDLFRWQAELDTALPDTDGNAATRLGSVAVAGPARLRTYTIVVNWAEPSEPNGLTYTLRMQI